MTVTLRDAMDAYAERKQAAFGADVVVITTRDASRVLLVGTGIDADEFDEVSQTVTRNALFLVAFHDVPPAGALEMLWREGVLAGILLAQLQAREDAKP